MQKKEREKFTTEAASNKREKSTQKIHCRHEQNNEKEKSTLEENNLIQLSLYQQRLLFKSDMNCDQTTSNKNFQ